MWPIVVGAAAVVGLLAGGVMSLDRHDAPPPPPTALTATAATCVPPTCDHIASTVTLAWIPPSDVSLTGFRVLRDGATLPGAGDLPASATGFVDHDVAAGGQHDYTVVAAGPAGDSPPSNGVGALLPLPPLAAAQFRGLYDVSLVVRTASNLMSLSGIPSPRPGEHRMSTWGFQPSCAANEGACPTEWTGRAGMLRAQGDAWAGRVFGPPARCPNGTRESSPIAIRLSPRSAAMIAGDWSVTGFTALYSVGFHCPGFLASRGTLAVRGHHR